MNFSMNRRAAFLESAQAEMVETIGSPAVVEAIGQRAAQRIVELNDRLFIPNMRRGRIVIPESYLDTEAVPYLAMKPGETYIMDQTMLTPTPLQQQGLGVEVAEIWGPSYNADAMARTLIELQPTDSQSSEIPKVTIKDNYGMVMANVKNVQVPLPGEESSSATIGIRGRPLLGLAYMLGYARQVTLAHELVHVEQFVRFPVVPAELLASRQAMRRMELEAYHYGAHYGKALYSAEQPQPQVRNELADLYLQETLIYQDHPLLNNYNVESIRQRYADPDRPFEPTPAMMEAMKITEATWAEDDFEPHTDLSN